MFTSKYLLLAAPKDWYDASADLGLTAMQFTGPWTFPSITKNSATTTAPSRGRRCRAANSQSSWVPTAPASTPSPRMSTPQRFAKWLWVDQTDKQLDFATAYGFHIPARASLAAQAKTLQSGPAKGRRRGRAGVRPRPEPDPVDPEVRHRLQRHDDQGRQDGADAKAEIAKVKAVAEAEVKRVLG